MKSLSLALLLLVLPPAALAQHSKAPDCATCHVSTAPATGDAALRACPRNEAGPMEAEGEVAPDVFLLGELSDVYVPVVFPHKLHAEMPGMSQGCESCHHQNPPGRILSCKECHSRNSNQENLKQPGLRGAYHRQCLACHREWTHQTDCVVCHAKREAGKTVTLPLDSTDIMGTLHPNIEAPTVKVYQTKDEMLAATPIVTFHHDEHVNRFGLKCVSCHRDESCSSCHDGKERRQHVKEDPHQDCAKCHQEQIDNDCAMCHQEQQTKGFDHGARSSFVLKAYHESLPCSKCHGENPESYAGLNQECGSCHAADWTPPENFDHAKTGQPLNEIHALIACADCHVNGALQPAKCDACHDDQRTKFPPAEGEAAPAPAETATPADKPATQ